MPFGQWFHWLCLGNSAWGSRTPVSRAKSKYQCPDMEPMKSFRSFMVSQSGELSLEQAQEMYDKYQLQYIEDVSKHFFENSKYEEWFREKYDPLLQQNRAEELQAWSQRSSASFRQQLIENYSDQIHSIRLYSPPGNKDSGGMCL